MSNTYPADQTALVVVDALNEFLSEGGKLHGLTQPVADEVGTVANLERVVAAARAAGIRVVYANHHENQGGEYDHWQFLNPSHDGTKNFDLFAAGSFGAEVHPAVAPQEEDLIAGQHWTASAFANTDLDFLLKMHRISRVVIVGNRANTCIDATGRYAVELGYHATLISDAIAAFSEAEMTATISTNWPAFGHGVITTAEFVEQLSAD